MAKMLRGGKNVNKAHNGLYGCGGGCCNSKKDRRKAKHGVRLEEKRQWKLDQQ